MGCLIYASDIKLRTETLDNFYYPDVMVVCGQNNGDLGVTFETVPCLLVEVLSKSTVRIRLPRQAGRLHRASRLTDLPDREADQA